MLPSLSEEVRQFVRGEGARSVERRLTVRKEVCGISPCLIDRARKSPCRSRMSENSTEKIPTLRDALVGQTVIVRRLSGSGAVKRRIMDMGLTKGTPVYIRRVAPLGDPVEVTVRGYELSIRKADAEMVLIEEQ